MCFPIPHQRKLSYSFEDGRLLVSYETNNTCWFQISTWTCCVATVAAVADVWVIASTGLMMLLRRQTPLRHWATQLSSQSFSCYNKSEISPFDLSEREHKLCVLGGREHFILALPVGTTKVGVVGFFFRWTSLSLKVKRQVFPGARAGAGGGWSCLPRRKRKLENSPNASNVMFVRLSVVSILLLSFFLSLRMSCSRSLCLANSCFID